MHLTPAVQKPVYSVGSLATLEGGYGPTYRGKRTSNANTVKEMHTAKSERERTLQMSHKRDANT